MKRLCLTTVLILAMSNMLFAKYHIRHPHPHYHTETSPSDDNQDDNPDDEDKNQEKVMQMMSQMMKQMSNLQRQTMQMARKVNPEPKNPEENKCISFFDQFM